MFDTLSPRTSPPKKNHPKKLMTCSINPAHLSRGSPQHKGSKLHNANAVPRSSGFTASAAKNPRFGFTASGSRHATSVDDTCVTKKTWNFWWLPTPGVVEVILTSRSDRRISCGGFMCFFLKAFMEGGLRCCCDRTERLLHPFLIR